MAVLENARFNTGMDNTALVCYIYLLNIVSSNSKLSNSNNIIL